MKNNSKSSIKINSKFIRFDWTPPLTLTSMRLIAISLKHFFYDSCSTSLLQLNFELHYSLGDPTKTQKLDPSSNFATLSDQVRPHFKDDGASSIVIEAFIYQT